jgi:hypothetical protein
VRIARAVEGPGVARTGLTVNGSAARSRSAVSVGDGGVLSAAGMLAVAQLAQAGVDVVSADDLVAETGGGDGG